MNYEQAKREADLREARRNPPAHEMTMRDEFAARAMQAILTHGYPITRELVAEQAISDAAYQQADAMLKARTR